MLEWVWRKGKPPALFVGMEAGTTTMENSTEVLFRKLYIEPLYDPAIPLLETYPEKTLI